MERDRALRRHVGEVYDQIANDYDRTRNRPWPEVVDFIDRCEGAVAVDVGSGNGHNSELLVRRGFSVVAVDRSVPLLRTAMRRRLPEGRRIDLVQGDMTSLPLRDGDFDAAIVIAAIHHLPSEGLRHAAISEIHRVLRPGGVGLITSWGTEQEKVPWNEMRRSIKTGRGRLDLEDEWDRFVPWKVGGEVRWRYYHYMTEEELGELAAEVFDDVHAYSARGNVLVEVRR